MKMLVDNSSNTRISKFCVGAWLVAVCAAALLVSVSVQADIPTAFAYQGRLSDGAAAASGDFDFVFQLYSAETGGTKAKEARIPHVPVSDGYFTVMVDFGADVFTNRVWFMEIYVRPSDVGLYTRLAPRQPTMPTPYAMCADKVTSGAVHAGGLEPDAIRSWSIKDGEVSGDDLALGAITTDHIADGTITPDDAAGGLYTSKSQLYVRTSSLLLSGYGTSQVEVSCDDANDLPLSGYTDVPDGVAIGLVFAKAVDWDSRTNPAAYRACFFNRTSNPRECVVGIICIRVD